MQSLDTIRYASGDSPKPETNTSHYRIYGHHLCPFVQRATLAFAAKEIEFQYA